jgi:hypothetical protein
LLLEPVQGGQGRSDAQVVGDRPVAEGHVEVGADEDSLALEVAQVLELGDVPH